MLTEHVQYFEIAIAKIQTLNMNLSNATPSNFKWTSKQQNAYTTTRIFYDAHWMGWDFRLAVSLSFQVVEEKSNAEFSESFIVHYCLFMYNKKVPNVA